ncbi:hypothetical protein ACEXQE_18715 [Herbiconiux sp. P17]|uniref:hypothetical protein n=1 Tax=Herbiconiux wuyangfengii TaxID=3342794 RepID=UPI0035B84F97
MSGCPAVLPMPGSVHPTADIADRLQLRPDVWAEQKTHGRPPDADKRFSFVIGVYDDRVPSRPTS